LYTDEERKNRKLKTEGDFIMNQNFLTVIKRIVFEQGEDILTSPQRLKGLISDYAKNEPKPERLAFGRCIEYGFYGELKKAAAPEERVRVKAALAQRLHSEEGLDLALCSETLDLLEAVIWGVQQQKILCANCGEELQEGWAMCPFCGTATEEDETAEPQESTSTPQPYLESVPENIFLKAIVTAEQEYPFYAMNNGNLIITNKRIVYKSSKLLNVDLFGSADSDVSIYYDEIAEFRSTKYNLVFPAIEITTKNGYKIKFSGYGKVNKAYDLIRELGGFS
jgi:hypothetical protein